MSGEDEYKEIIRQCIGSVKEVFGEGRFDDVVASIMCRRRFWLQA